MENKSKGKVWLITGASGGLGMALTSVLLEKGHKVAVVSRTALTAGRIPDARPENWLSLKIDITDEENVAAAIKATIDYFGQLDVVVNNAGYSLYGSVEAVSDSELRQLMDVNFFGAANTIRCVMPYFRAQRSGYVINIASVAGYKGYGNSPSYAASKFAMVGLSESLAEEVRPFNIKVTVVAPGFFRTGFLDKGESLLSKKRIPEYQVDVLENRLRNMNGSQPGDPRKLAAVLVDLADNPEPPVHLLMGADAYGIVTEKRKAENAEFEQWRMMTFSTDFDKA